MTLLDSDVLIAHLRGVDAAGRCLTERRRRAPLHASVVSLAEITGGLHSHERREVWRLLAGLRIEPVTERMGVRAGQLMRRFRRSHSSIGLGDYLIAATAIELGLELATLNVRHFPMFEALAPAFDL